MSVWITKRGDTLFATIPSEFTVNNRQELKQRLLIELARGERLFEIDFSQTDYIDTAALGTLLSLSRKIRDEGGLLRLAHLHEDLRKLFALTRLDSLFQITESSHAAAPVQTSANQRE